jgi:hypothetical protein
MLTLVPAKHLLQCWQQCLSAQRCTVEQSTAIPRSATILPGDGYFALSNPKGGRAFCFTRLYLQDGIALFK